jgi:NitT/TauT family transport system permease protein
MFAALLLIALAGVAIYAMTTILQHLLLRKWHESAITRDR